MTLSGPKCKRLALWCAFAVSVSWAGALQAAELIRFHFERTGVQVPAYTIVLNTDGSGTYSEGSGSEKSPAPEADTGTLRRSSPVRVSSAMLDKLLAGRVGVGEKTCETRLKHIANTGRKTLTYAGDGTPASCTFNFSDTPALNDVAAAFIAMAETLQAGERLAAKHRFDRLGLDLEMESLVEEVRAGRAVEVANIAPVLRSIADDERVIDRVRRSAARLLHDSAPPAAESVDLSPPNLR